MNDIKILSGIDSLYYFVQSNGNYSDLFYDIEDQLETIQGKFKKLDIDFENSDINITIEDTTLTYLGKAEGFHWFRDLNNFFKIGFKDNTKNTRLHNIRVQLQGVGIYTIGIKNLLKIINDELLINYTIKYYPVTRADLNCFIQYDFSFINRDMFVTKKRQYATISEIGSANTLQTIYIGREPFKLRLYNKTLEMKKSNKLHIMSDYFNHNGFNLQDTIFNVEFQLNRQHLRLFKIDTVDNLLSNAKNLFRASMDEIKLVDLNSISNTTAKSNNKNRANTHPIWEHIKNSYDIKEFLQADKQIIRVKRKISLYDDPKFKDEYIALIRKAFIHTVQISKDILNEYYDEVKDSFSGKNRNKPIKKTYIDIDMTHKDGRQEELRLLNSGELIKPVNVISVNKLGDYTLNQYVKDTKAQSHLSQKHLDIYKVALKEAIKRGLISQEVQDD